MREELEYIVRWLESEHSSDSDQPWCLKDVVTHALQQALKGEQVVLYELPDYDQGRKLVPFEGRSDG